MISPKICLKPQFLGLRYVHPLLGFFLVKTAFLFRAIVLILERSQHIETNETWMVIFIYFWIYIYICYT